MACVLEIHLTEEEKEILEKEAAIKQVSLNKYILFTMLSLSKEAILNEKRFKGLSKQLRR